MNYDNVSFEPAEITWVFHELDTDNVRLVTNKRKLITLKLDADETEQLITEMKKANPKVWVGAFQGNRIPLADLPNTRGLGGLESGKNSVIANHRLIRSGALHDATAEDIDYLRNVMKLSVIIDLRTEMERVLKPDPVIPGVKELHLPLLDTIEYESIGLRTLSESGVREMMKKGPDMMEEMYRKMVADPEGIRGLKRFFEVLLNLDSGSCLWHCTQGKDRTGICAALLEEVLGCDRKTIMTDYLVTNACLKEEEDETEAKMRQLLGLSPSQTAEMNFLFEAQPRFLEGAWDEIDKKFGSMSEYLEKQLGLTPDKQAQLKQMFTV